jgi:hypothetical protein
VVTFLTDNTKIVVRGTSVLLVVEAELSFRNHGQAKLKLQEVTAFLFHHRENKATKRVSNQSPSGLPPQRMPSITLMLKWFNRFDRKRGIYDT